jgi:hypothetical protein
MLDYIEGKGEALCPGGRPLLNGWKTKASKTHYRGLVDKTAKSLPKKQKTHQHHGSSLVNVYKPKTP